MTDNDARQPTDSKELERQIMDSNVPKNEREWWAHSEITTLQERVADLDRLVDKWRDRALLAEPSLAEALEVVRRLYAYGDYWKQMGMEYSDMERVRALLAKHGASK